MPQQPQQQHGTDRIRTSANGISNVQYPNPERIRQLREAAGFHTRLGLAKELGLTCKTIENYERGVRHMTDVLICARFARAVGVNVDELLAN